MSILLAFVVAINASSFGWSITSSDPRSIITNVLQIVLSLYLLVLAGLSVKELDVVAHTYSILHITALSTTITLLFFAAAILPSTPPVAAGEVDHVPVGLWYATLVLYALVCVISITTPLGPKLHFPSERIYSEKVIMAITNKDEENVCGLVGAFLNLCLHTGANHNVYPRCICMGHPSLFVHNQSCLVRQRCCQSGHWRLADRTRKHACHIQLRSNETGYARDKVTYLVMVA